MRLQVVYKQVSKMILFYVNLLVVRRLGDWKARLWKMHIVKIVYSNKYIGNKKCHKMQLINVARTNQHGFKDFLFPSCDASVAAERCYLGRVFCRFKIIDELLDVMQMNFS